MRGAAGPRGEARPREAKLSEYLKKKRPLVTPLPKYGDRPDRIIRVLPAPDGSGWVARVAGDEVDASRFPEFRGKDTGALMRAGLENYLDRQALVFRLYQLTGAAPSEKARWDAAWTARSDKPKYRAGDALSFTVGGGGQEGLLYVLDRDEADGVVQMVWPLLQEPDNRLTADAAEVKVPRALSFRLPGDQAPGKTFTRALFVEGKAKLPSLTPPPGGWTDPARYSAAEVAHLKALVEVIEKKRARWRVVDFEYEVVP
jgi:hypothetical protein